MIELPQVSADQWYEPLNNSRAPRHRQPVAALSIPGQEAVEVDGGAVGDVSITLRALTQADEIPTLYPLALGRIKPQVLLTMVMVRVAVPIALARRMRIAENPLNIIIRCGYRSGRKSLISVAQLIHWLPLSFFLFCWVLSFDMQFLHFRWLLFLCWCIPCARLGS